MRDPWKNGVPFELMSVYGGDFDIEPSDVYRDIFRLRSNSMSDGKGVIQSSGENKNLKANPIVYYKNHLSDEHGHFRVILEDTFDSDYDMLCNAEFVIMNGITYFGRRNLQDHASKMYAMIFDIDGVDSKKLKNLLHQASHGLSPMPNYLVFSGSGVHLYYIFETPIALFPYTKIQLKSLKYALTRILWNRHTSHIKEPQYQGINQGFRLVGGRTKEGCRIDASFPVAFRKEFYTISELNQYVPKENQVDESKLYKESKYTLEEAKEKFPKWYERVILNKDTTPLDTSKRRKWKIEEKVHGDNPYALYDWWLNKIGSGATYGHRYFCIMMLAIYAVKCNVPRERLEKDALALIPNMNTINPDEKFTEDDVKSALECFDDRYATFPLRDIEKLSAISIERNKRNGRSQKVHLEVARGSLSGINKSVGHNVQGRKNAKNKVETWQSEHPNGTQKECEFALGLAHSTVSKYWNKKNSLELVLEWRKLHPDGKKVSCIRDTGLDKKTVYKWWDYSPEVFETNNTELENNIGFFDFENINTNTGILSMDTYEDDFMDVLDDSYESDFMDVPDDPYESELTEEPVEEEVFEESYSSKLERWREWLPEFYIIEGSNDISILDPRFKKARSIEILESDEYIYLASKQAYFDKNKNYMRKKYWYLGAKDEILIYIYTDDEKFPYFQFKMKDLK